ncbi:ABC transporter ATP-binding protein [Occultella kanbiaonis]|uniref:ABC transporter ATP-binding protein n=1 Tax=Occultella kanbiaonis TaxID=2675754 RepID=UPI0013D7DD64|nr:ABC transporter ATP-binding protein [Occultella kanbiaonis]
MSDDTLTQQTDLDVGTPAVETTAEIAARLEASPPLLVADHLDVTYVTEDGEIPACRDVNFTLHRGEILGIAGESASGKSTLLNALSRLQRPPAVTSGGSVTFHPTDGGEPLELTAMNDEQLRRHRWTSLSIVMQSAMASLNPVIKLGVQFTDVIREHEPDVTKAQARERAGALLEMVGIPRHRLSAFPFQLSGGMQQRALIALSLACHPDVVFMDEPTTAVDVIMQRQILSQILQLQGRLGFAIVFITHDLSLLMEISDRIAIMYAGRFVEMGMPEQIHGAALHPYTRGLRRSFPPLSEPIRRLEGIPGTPPDLLDLPTGCSFVPRCPLATEICRVERPELREVDGGLAACHHASATPDPREERTDA